MKVGRESPEELRERVKKIIKLLREHYPHSRTALHYETPFQLLVATILAAQCTDEKVNQITPLLFKKYPTIADLARASQAEVEAIIRPTGFSGIKLATLSPPPGLLWRNSAEKFLTGWRN